MTRRGWILTVATLLTASQAPGLAAEASLEIVLSGRVVCLEAEGEAPISIACDPPPPQYGFKTSDGQFYRFEKSDERTIMFTDPRVRERTLQVTAWLTDRRELQIIKIQAVQEEGLLDLYYFCSICNIKAHTPGPCWCCQEEFEFIETPAQESP